MQTAQALDPLIARVPGDVALDRRSSGIRIGACTLWSYSISPTAR